MPAHVVRKREKRKVKEWLWVRHKREGEARVQKTSWRWGRVIFWLVGFTLFGFMSWQVWLSGEMLPGERVNFLFGTEKDGLVWISLAADDSELMGVYIHPDVIVQTIGGYSEYRAGALFGLAELENKGEDLVLQSIGRTVGVWMHDFVPMKLGGFQEYNREFLRSSWLALAKNNWQKPSRWLLIGRYGRAIERLRSDQIMILPLHESRLSYQNQLVDGSISYVIDPDRFDLWVREAIGRLPFSGETWEVAVVNTTSVAGLAGELARSLMNMGVDVVAVGENSDRLAESLIEVTSKDLVDSPTTQAIERWLGTEATVAEVGEHRASIVVLLGDDFNRYLNGR